MLGVAVISLAVSDPRAAILAWALPIGASALCLDSIGGGPVKRALAGARRQIAARRDMIAGTLGRYFAWRFFKTIAAVFVGVLC
jgi:hypothetical protein